MKIHYIHRGLYNNAGMEFPECRAFDKMLDLDASSYSKTHDKKNVTCKHCLKRIAERKW